MSSSKQNQSKQIYQSLIRDLPERLNEMEEEGSIFPLTDEFSAIGARYSPQAEIGRGGMKRIIAADDNLTGRKIAQAYLIKSDDPELEELFLKEVRLTAALEHPNIVPLYDFVYNPEGESFFNMKLIEGKNLAHYIKSLEAQKTPSSLHETMQIFLKICDAISYAHSQNILHLDLKPANIRIGKFGEVLVCDWGLARVIVPEESSDVMIPQHDSGIYNNPSLHGRIKGSPGFMAPEQISSKLGNKNQTTDIYALGALLYFMLCHQAPISGGDLRSTLKQTLKGNIQKPSSLQDKIPPGLEAIAMKALSTEQVKRYQTVQEISQDIDRWMEGFLTSAEKSSSLKSVYLFYHRHRSMTIILAILFLTVTLGSLFFSLKINREKLHTDEAFVLYRQEQVAKDLLGKEASPYLNQLAKVQLFQNDNLDQAEKLFDLALLRDPENLIANHHKIYIHFYKMEFSQSKRLLALYPPLAPNHSLKALQQELQKPKYSIDHLLTLDEFISFLNTADPRLRSEKYRSLMYNLKHYTLKERISLCKGFWAKSKSKKSHWSLMKSPGKILSVDLSLNNDSRNLNILRSLPITHLNISNSKKNTLQIITSLPLIELNMLNAKFLYPSKAINKTSLIKTIFSIKSLRNLSISKTFSLEGERPPKRLKIIRL